MSSLWYCPPILVSQDLLSGSAVACLQCLVQTLSYWSHDIKGFPAWSEFPEISKLVFDLNSRAQQRQADEVAPVADVLDDIVQALQILNVASQVHCCRSQDASQSAAKPTANSCSNQLSMASDTKFSCVDFQLSRSSGEDLFCHASSKLSRHVLLLTIWLAVKAHEKSLT